MLEIGLVDAVFHEESEYYNFHGSNEVKNTSKIDKTLKNPFFVMKNGFLRSMEKP